MCDCPACTLNMLVAEAMSHLIPEIYVYLAEQEGRDV